MKYNTQDLYFAKCRHCIMDIINVIGDDGHIMSPHPDYLDYYTILHYKNGKYINVSNKKIKYGKTFNIDDKDHYGEDLILEIEPLLNWVYLYREYLSDKDCELVESIMEQTMNLTSKYGYKNIEIEEAQVTQHASYDVKELREKNRQYLEYAKEQIQKILDEFEKLAQKDPEEARRIAREAVIQGLIESGIINEKGEITAPYNQESINNKKEQEKVKKLTKE